MDITVRKLFFHLRAIVSVSIIVVFAHTPSPTQDISNATQKPVGIVLNVGCPGWLDSPQFGPPMPIDNTHDRGRPLYVGDKVRCKGDGELSIWTGRDRAISYSDGWVAVEDTAITAAQHAKQKAVAETLEDSKDRSSRSAPSAIFCPAAGGVVRPETFVIRWNPEEGDTGTIAVSIWQPGGKRLCCEQSLEALSSTGMLDSIALRNGLTSIRNAHESLPLELQFVDSARKVSVVKFFVLGADEELVLEQQLARWETEQSPIVQHMGRAYVYNSSGLSVEAADEFDQLLRESEPPSEYLIREAIQAHMRVGNNERVKQLKKQIE